MVVRIATSDSCGSRGSFARIERIVRGSILALLMVVLPVAVTVVAVEVAVFVDTNREEIECSEAIDSTSEIYLGYYLNNFFQARENERLKYSPSQDCCLFYSVDQGYYCSESFQIC